MSTQTTTSGLLLALALTVAAPALAQPAPPQPPRGGRDESMWRPPYQQGREEQIDRQTRTLKLGAQGELALANLAGDIVVTRSSGSEATIEIVKIARARTADEARAMLGLVDVSVVERDGRAEVKAVYGHGDDWRGERGDRGDRGDRGGRRMAVSVAYTVAAPAQTRLTVGSVSGNVRVTDIRGDLSISSVSGGVRIANAGRIAEAKSVSGNVEIVDSQVDGAIEAQSVSGSVTLRKVNARRIEVGSVSGSVVLQDLKCDRVEGHSVSGGIEFGGALSKAGRYEFASHSGDARITVDGGTGFDLTARSFSGSVRADLPLVQDAADRDAPQNRHSLRGVHGDGSAVLSVTTFSGDIIVGKR